MVLHNDWNLFNTCRTRLGDDVNYWMFGAEWAFLDNSPFGASFRIDHYLECRNPSLYDLPHVEQMARYYPKNAFWMG